MQERALEKAIREVRETVEKSEGLELETSNDGILEIVKKSAQARALFENAVVAEMLNEPWRDVKHLIWTRDGTKNLPTDLT